MQAPQSIKKVNLQNIQKPKTLVVIHYKSKRVSIPIFDQTTNLVQYLWHQLKKFQATVLADKTNNSRNTLDVNQIIGFTFFQSQKNRIDLKMNILLSFSRLSHDHGRSRTDLTDLDITKYYKYLQIQPYYGYRSKQLIPQYQLYTVLSSNSYSNTYLGKRLSDGRFFSIKVCRTDNKLAYNQYVTLKNCSGGKFRNFMKRKFTEIQCLYYMKQLVWGVHTLHKVFNFIHRAISLDNIQIDFLGNLRLTQFSFCQPCYNTFNGYSSPQTYNQQYKFANMKTPPEVARSGSYNHLVDYFAVGDLLSQLYQGQDQDGSKQGIQIAIDNLMADNIKQRQYFVNQVISQLHQQKVKQYSSRIKIQQVSQYQRLSFNNIYVGQNIKANQVNKNGIRHQDILKILKPSNDQPFYYLNPIKKKKDKSKSKDSKIQKKSKKKSKSKDVFLSKLSQCNSQKSYNQTKNSFLNRSDKSINKSIDSAKNSATSKNSKSKSKVTKQKNLTILTSNNGSSSKNKVVTQIPKSPTMKVNQRLKSPGPTTKNSNSNAKILSQNILKNKY